MQRRRTLALLAAGAVAFLAGVYLLAQPKLGWPLPALADMAAPASTTRNFTGAIAVRVFRNPNRLDPLSWYRSQDFTQGNPAQTTVDGYPGLEEGSSVYVSAPNYSQVSSPSCATPPCAFVNVYLMSYGQGSDDATVEIARRLRQNWEFMANIPVDVTEGAPIAREKLRRDNLRLTALGTIAQALQRYRQANGSYPSLAAGTYLPGRTVSTWPSWLGSFSASLGLPAPTDPVNNFSPTWPYDGPSACNTAQGFATGTCYAAPGTPGGGSAGAYQCPSGSHVFEYENGTRTKVYTNFEFKGDPGIGIRWPSGLLRGTVDVGSANDCQSFFVDLDARGSSWGSTWPSS